MVSHHDARGHAHSAAMVTVDLTLAGAVFRIRGADTVFL
jgi:hypothetical protein